MSRTELRPRTPGRRRTTGFALIAVVIVLLVATGAILWATVLPGALTNVTAGVAEADITLTVGDQNAPVTVTVPSGWVTERPPFRGETVTMRSPDGVLALTLTANATDVEQAFAAASRDAGDVSRPLTETLGSGHTAVHGRSASVLAAAVGTPDTGRSATVIARVSGGALVDYLPAVGQILDGLRVSS